METRVVGLSLPGSDAHGLLNRTGTAQILEQEDHLVLLILPGTHAMGLGRHGAAPAVLKLLDGFRQLRPAASASPAGFENARS